MSRIFGTDGIRAVANSELTPFLTQKIGECAVRLLAPDKKGVRSIIGMDTRKSSRLLDFALASGIASAGSDVYSLGVLPTPAIAYLSKKLNVDFGIMISASHNLMEDNGIKIFTNEGYKLSDDIENSIEKLIKKESGFVSPLLNQKPYWDIPTADEIGQIRTDDQKSAQDLYKQYLLDSLELFLECKQSDLSLSKLNIVLDAANGSASKIGPDVFRELNANLTVINNSPDGKNINLNCGSTNVKKLSAMVVASEADIGVAFDGDADRLIVVDEKGSVVDGDKIMAILALFMKEKEQLVKNTLVATVMSNIGFINSLKKEGIDVLRANVGDRYVLETMKENGLIFGGEQSGHIINLNLSTTGDGILSALCFCSVLLLSNKKLSEIISFIEQYPQRFINVSGVDKNKIDTDSVIKKEIKRITNVLGEQGRVLVRKSGTENLIRVMVESSDSRQTEKYCNYLATLIEERLSI